MVELLERLCNTDGTSGDETAVSDFIISEIDGYCDWKKDNLGNIIAFKKGKKTPLKKVMIDAHTDEVGLIITSVTNDGFLKFTAVGGIETESLMSRRVKINGRINGVISSKPVHLLSKDEKKKLPTVDSLYIDIGAKDKAEALKTVSLGDRAVMCGDFVLSGDRMLSKALDDRVGCAILIDMIKADAEYDFYATFSVQEELGMRGARVSTYAVNPDCAIVLEATTASDIAGVSEESTVCNVGDGPCVSFMDRATVYDREFYNAAIESGIKCQSKRAVKGGNNSGAIHLSREGVRTIAVSLPCRYIHSSSSVASKEDMENMKKLCEYLLPKMANGEI